jgi:uncharacterized protein involved in outer membrane biogenesis
MVIKKVLIAFGLLAAFIVLVGAVGILFIDPIARSVVEKQSAVALKVPTKLHDATIRFSGHATLGKLEIGNPTPFTEPQSITFERFDVAVKPRQLLGEVVHIGDVTIVRPELTLEFAGAKNNLSALLDNLSAGQPAGQTAPSGGKKFLIRKLRIQDAVARFKSDLLSGGARSVTLPAIELENIGTAEGGASMGQIIRVILEALGTSALKAGEGLLPADLLKSLRGDLEGKIRELPTKAMDDIQKKAGELKLPSDLEKLKKSLEHKSAD